MRTVVTTLVVAIGLLLVGTAEAQDCCPPVGQGCGTPACGDGHNCGHPGAACCPHPRKVCKVVCEMKKVTTHCWCVEYEEFCVPLPRLGIGWGNPCGLCGQSCGGSCGPACGGGGGCGKVRVRKKLVKKEITKEIPVYRCVVVDCCEAGACPGGGADPGYAAPVAGEPTEAAPQMAPIDEEAAPLPPAPTP